MGSYAIEGSVGSGPQLYLLRHEGEETSLEKSQYRIRGLRRRCTTFQSRLFMFWGEGPFVFPPGSDAVSLSAHGLLSQANVRLDYPGKQAKTLRGSLARRRCSPR